jgi:hypothetical protein
MLLQRDARILLPAPALAEVLRYGGAAPPRRRELVIGAFDERSAQVLGEKFPLAELEAVKVQQGSSITHLKYDSMIVACAIRYQVDVHISLDTDQHKFCEKASFACMWPDQFVQKYASRELA